MQMTQAALETAFAMTVELAARARNVLWEQIALTVGRGCWGQRTLLCPGSCRRRQLLMSTITMRAVIVAPLCTLETLETCARKLQCGT